MYRYFLKVTPIIFLSSIKEACWFVSVRDWELKAGDVKESGKYFFSIYFIELGFIVISDCFLLWEEVLTTEISIHNGSFLLELDGVLFFFISNGFLEYMTYLVAFILLVFFVFKSSPSFYIYFYDFTCSFSVILTSVKGSILSEKYCLETFWLQLFVLNQRPFYFIKN